MKMKALVAQLCPILCEPMDYNIPDSSVRGILQARILEWVAISFSRESSWPREQIHISCIANGFFTTSATWEAHSLSYLMLILILRGKKATVLYLAAGYTKALEDK